MISNQTKMVSKTPRDSNLELYRIICMFLIVCHHYIACSGLTSNLLPENADSINSLFYWLLSMWGKAGINCFMLITGYFMCKSNITWQKFWKLILQIYFWKIMIFCAFHIAGLDPMTPKRLLGILLPVYGFNHNFTSCFIVFWLTIPFWNIFIRNISERQHVLLTALLLSCYTGLSWLPGFDVTFNYVSWFGVIYLIASYIRLYPKSIFEKRWVWGLATGLTLLASVASVVGMHFLFKDKQHFWITDSNMIMAVLVSVTSFLLFRTFKFQSRIINTIASAAFGVLLIHSGSRAMMTWLWGDVVDVSGHFDTPYFYLYSIGCCMAIYIVCTIIELLRIKLIEPLYMNPINKHYADRTNK